MPGKDYERAESLSGSGTERSGAQRWMTDKGGPTQTRERESKGDTWLGTSGTGAPTKHLVGSPGTHDGEVGRTREVTGPPTASDILNDP